jgi:hypothetical protein
MTLPRSWQLMAIILVLLSRHVANGQTLQFLPEIDVYHKLNPKVRFVFQAKETREAGDPTQAEIGPSVEFNIKPLISLRSISVFDLENRFAVFSIGYRYLPSPDKPTVNRMLPIATFNLPLKGGMVISDRNRGDLDWSNGDFTWRYRNRISLERGFKIHTYQLKPYARAEFFYESKYKKWGTTALSAGCSLPVGTRVQFDPYYRHQNNTGPTPNQQLNQLGLILRLYF